MTSFALRWISVAIMAVGICLLTVPHIGPWADGFAGRASYLIPVSYFAMLLGAVGLSIGWFLKQR